MPLLAPLRLPHVGLSQVDSIRRWTKSAWQGVVEIGHNSLAVVGLACIGVVLFFSGDSALRHQIERQALEWLNLRHGALVSGIAEVNTVDLLADLNEPEAVARATARPLSALPRQQAQVASWIARRYRVAPEPIARLVQEAWLIGKKANLDPTLILAIMAIESSFNPFAQSPVGAQGLMQVMTHVHDDKYASFGGKLAAFDPVTNLRVGVQVLTECIARAGGSLEAGLKFYVGAANLPDDGGYAERVLSEQNYLRQVAEGQNVAVTVPFQRPTTAGSSNAPVVAAATVSNASVSPTSVFGAAAAAVSKAIPFVGGGNTVMAPALGAPVAVNLSNSSGSSTPSTSVPSAMTVPVADKSPPSAATHAPNPPAAIAPAAVPPATPATNVGPAPAMPAAPAVINSTQSAPAVLTIKPVVSAPAASAPVDAEPRPAKPKTETAAAPAATADARVAMAAGAPR